MSSKKSIAIAAPGHASLISTIIDDIREVGSAPQASILLVDGSASIGTAIFHGVMKSILMSLISSLPSNEHICLIQFSTIARIECPFTSSKEGIASFITDMEYIGRSTRTRVGVDLAYTLLRQECAQTGTMGRLFILTDGMPDDKYDPITVCTTMRNDPIIKSIFAIGVGQPHKLSLSMLQTWTAKAFLFPDFPQLLFDLQSASSSDPLCLVSLKVYPSKTHTSQSGRMNPLCLICEITNVSLMTVPKDSHVVFHANDYFNAAAHQIHLPIEAQKSIAFEIMLTVSIHARFSNFPEQVFWTISSAAGISLLKGSIAIGTQFLAREFLPVYPSILVSNPNPPAIWGNCLVFGFMGNGKSSLLNGILTCLTSSDRIRVLPALSYHSHVTDTYVRITLDGFQKQMLVGDRRFPIHFWDTWGLTTENYEIFPYLLTGAIPHGFKMTDATSSTFACMTPSEDRRIHCILFVISAAIRTMEPLMKIFRRHIEISLRMGYNPLVIVTHIDLEESLDDQRLKMDMHHATGINPNRIFLHQNYTEENSRSPRIDLSSLLIVAEIFKQIRVFTRLKHIPASSIPQN